MFFDNFDNLNNDIMKFARVFVNASQLVQTSQRLRHHTHRLAILFYDNQTFRINLKPVCHCISDKKHYFKNAAILLDVIDSACNMCDNVISHNYPPFKTALYLQII